MRTVAVTLSVVLFACVAGCGGKAKPAATTTVDDGADESSGGDVIPAERMAEIKAMLDRKRNTAARCLADAINHGTVPKNAHGHVALGFTIGTDGAAVAMKVIESSIDSPVVEQCVMDKVQQIDFGALPTSIEWSYTYAFESM